LVFGLIGGPIEISVAMPKSHPPGNLPLGPNPTPLRPSLRPVIAPRDPATPRRTPFPVLLSSTVQPRPVPLAFQGVHARLLKRIHMIRHSDQGVISISQIIPDAAPFMAAVIRRPAVGPRRKPASLIAHPLIVPRAKRSQTRIEYIGCCRLWRHRNSPKRRPQ
jgi:hypothetical protein